MSHILPKSVIAVLLILGPCVLCAPPTEVLAHQSSWCVDVPAVPAYLMSYTMSTAIAAINHARRSEDLPSLHLPGNFYQLTAAREQFVLLNLEREDRGLAPLSLNPELTRMAAAYSREMHTFHFISHRSPVDGSFGLRARRAGILRGHSEASENLAGNPVAGAGPIYEYLYNDGAEGCSHRDTILDPSLREVGIGVVYDAYYGSISAQEFVG